MKKFILLTFPVMLLTGCLIVSEPMQIGQNLFTVSSTADGYRMASDARNRALKAAAKKCVSLGKTMELVSENMTRTRMGIDTTIDLTFKCID